MSDSKFKRALDSELKNIGFSEQSRRKVLESTGLLQKSAQKDGRTATWGEWLQALLDKELVIPVRSLAVVVLVVISGLIYNCAGFAGISPDEIQRSSILIIDGAGTGFGGVIGPGRVNSGESGGSSGNGSGMGYGSNSGGNFGGSMGEGGRVTGNGGN